MTRPIQILFIVVLTVAFSAFSPPPLSADDMVLFKNGRTLRADELELEDGAYRITTMAGGVMEIPVQLVEQVISCVVDKDVEEQRGSVPAGTSRTSGSTMGNRSAVTRIPPVDSGAGTLGGSPIRGGRTEDRTGAATSIPPRGGRSLNRPDDGKAGARINPLKGREEKK